jgi:hypothetical protein
MRFDAQMVAVANGDMFGPDPLAKTCDAACSLPPAVCLDSRFAVQYSGGECIGGVCEWTKVDFDCVNLAGGTCVGGSSDGGIVQAYGGPSVVVQGCAIPIGDAAPPDVACDEDASPDAAVCPPPRSVCGSSNRIFYYDDGICVAGRCVWKLGTAGCSRCDDGGCISFPATPPPPPPPPNP